MEIHEILAAQKAYFESGATRPTAFRRAALQTLDHAVRTHEPEIAAALMQDLHKSAHESYLCETGLVLDEIRCHLRHLERWNRTVPVLPSAAQLPGVGLLLPEPIGVVLILAPWNYPIQLCLMPLIGAISAGCCAVLKPSAYAPASSRCLAKLIAECFPPQYIAVVEGGRKENQALLEEPFDHIFFTGSVAVGRAVMEAASKHLTPVTLELGGKSPVIVDETADLRLAARRIAFGKVLNAGQTCVAPDYLLIDERVEELFLQEYAEALRGFFPDGDDSQMVRIVSDKHFDRLSRLIEGREIAIGGGMDRETRRIAPTVLTGVSPEDPVMQEEIFGPILPVLTYRDLSEAIALIRSRPKPLALYLFTRSRAREKEIFGACSFGGGCVNDVCLHLTSSRMPFGGVGDSGMGRYHGKASFDTFTHMRSVLRKFGSIDPSLRNFPYTEQKARLSRLLLR